MANILPCSGLGQQCLVECALHTHKNSNPVLLNPDATDTMLRTAAHAPHTRYSSCAGAHLHVSCQLPPPALQHVERKRPHRLVHRRRQAALHQGNHLHSAKQ